MKRILLIAFAAMISAAGAGPAGFQVVRSPLMLGIWYPTTAAATPQRIGLTMVNVAPDAPLAGSHLPLVILSHGQQGSIGSHADTAVALAEAGFVVAAPLHTGDSFEDQSAVGGPRWFALRTADITAAIDYLVKQWPSHGAIDAGRIGLFGFSAGGTTALIAIGGKPDFAAIPAHCRTNPEFACTLWTGGPPVVPAYEPRIKAAVIAAPGFGFAFVPDGLRAVRVPVQFWSGSADTHVPGATNVAPLAKVLGPGTESWSVPGAGHFAFLAPCQGPPICTDAPGFERDSFHTSLNQGVVRFFRETLK